MLSDEAHQALVAQKKGKKDSLSQVILRFVPRSIRTFGDLERHLETVDAAVVVDYPALERVRQRKQSAKRAH